jgi:hypothetical protein
LPGIAFTEPVHASRPAADDFRHLVTNDTRFNGVSHCAAYILNPALPGITIFIIYTAYVSVFDVKFIGIQSKFVP